MATRNPNPSLKTALATALKVLKQEDLHSIDKNLAPCPHNAGIIFGCLQSMVLDAGYIPLGIMLGSLVRPCIDKAPIDDCQQCKDAFYQGK